MEIKITNKSKADVFTLIFQHLKLFTDKVSIQINEDNLYVQGMDDNHVSIFEINLQKEWFDHYHVHESDITLGINAVLFFKILNTRGDGQDIRLYSCENDNLEIDFTSESDTKSDFNKYFKMPLMDLDLEQLGIVDNEYDLEYSMNSKKFKGLVDQLASFSDVMQIKYSEDVISLKAESDCTEGSMEIKIDIDDMESCAVEETANFSVTYSIRFIQHMMQYFKVCATTEFYVSPDLPLQIKYKLDENEQNYIRFFLAPKINDDA